MTNLEKRLKLANEAKDLIIEYREENGPYKNIDELKTIGARIGEKTFETIKDKVYVP